MKKFANFAVEKRKTIFIVFIAALVLAAACIPFTAFNYDSASYLPPSSETKKALSVMEAEFGKNGNGIAMLQEQNMEKILETKEKIAQTEGVAGVMWLDDLFSPFQKSLGGETQLSDAALLEYAFRLVSVLPAEKDSTVLDLLAVLQEEFNEEELPVVFGLFSALSGGNLDLTNPEFMQSPLGESYSMTVQALKKQLYGFYTGENALFTIVFEEGDYAENTYKAIKSMNASIPGLYISGNAASAYFMQQSQLGEILRATLLAAAIALALLFLLSSSWYDPLIYIISIAGAIVLNMGTNLLFGSVSYLTGSVASVLQLALSIDYSVFLLNRYKKERKEGNDPKNAMVTALTRSFAPISASSLTTIACFITIMFMKYRLGFDMGAVMAKAILLSLITAFVLLPGVIVALDKKITAGEHKTFGFSAKKLSGFIFKGRYGIALAALALIIPAAFFAERNAFVYGGKTAQSPDSAGVVNLQKIEEVFGSKETLALLVPKDNGKETALALALTNTEGVADVTSRALLELSGAGALFPDALTQSLVGAKDYNRIVLALDVPEEGETTTALLAQIKTLTDGIYGSQGEEKSVYLLGNAAAALDMKTNTKDDFARISLYSLFAVALIVGLSFRSFLLPVLLVATIQGSIWINMSVPYLFGDKIIFVGYMIISNILLGATIDYAILFTSNYNESRALQTDGGKKGVLNALRSSFDHSLRPILTSGSIFALGGLALGLTSTFPTVKLSGYSIMRGGISAVALTVFALPAFLAISDKAIRFWETKKQRKTKTP